MSVLEQGVDELLVVDDASTDGSVALVRERFPDVRLIELERNSGPSVARNAGMRAARNRLVLAVDNDAVLCPGVLAKLRSALASSAGCVAAQPRSVLHDDPGRVHYDAGHFHYVGLLSLRNFYRPLVEAQAADGRALVAETDALIAIAPLVDRDALLDVGGYDEDFFYLAEDFDLALRLRQAGHTLVSVPDAIVLHRGGTAGLSFRGGGYPERRVFLHSRNRWLLMAKCYHWRTLCVALPGLVLYECVWSLFALAKGHLAAHLRGKLAFLRMLGAQAPKRRAVQARRRIPDRQLLVGGPLTFSPSLVEKAPARWVAAGLSGCLRAWWALARWLSG